MFGQSLLSGAFGSAACTTDTDQLFVTDTTATTTATYQLNGVTTSIPLDTYPGTPRQITYASGNFGNAASFNGYSEGSNINLGNNNVFTPTNNPITFSCWVNTSSTSTGYLVAKGNDHTIQYEWSIEQASNGTLTLYAYQSGGSGVACSINNTTAINDGDWHNVVGVIVNNTSTTLYIDGIPATSTSWTGTAQNYNLTLYLGAFGNAGGAAPVIPAATAHYEGLIDQVRFFTSALSQAAITALYAETVATSSSASISYQDGTYNGTTTNVGYTGLKFKPDLVWVKQRSSPARGHILSNSMSSSSSANSLAFMSSQNAEREYTGAEGGGTYIRTLDSNGFSVGSSNFTGAIGQTYVAWCFKASASTTTIPASGSQISSDVRANVDAGFSIVEATSTSSGVFTVGHGLNAAPELYIIKNKASAGGWLTYVKLLGADKYLQLNDSGAAGTSTRFWDNTLATPTVFTMESGYVISPNVDFLAYCWHSVSGYQKVGTYTGTGVASVNIISTEVTSGDGGFEPAFLLVKNTTVSTNNSWVIFDNKRSTTNPRDETLFPNLADIEYTYSNSGVNFNSTSFSLNQNIGEVNVSGNTYIYLAIA